MKAMTETGEPPFDRNKLAVALAYARGEDKAPKVAAKGKGHMAETIIALAKEHHIEIRQDSDLASLLSKLEVDALIPLEAYAAVAEILAYVYKANDTAKRQNT